MANSKIKLIYSTAAKQIIFTFKQVYFIDFKEIISTFREVYPIASK